MILVIKEAGDRSVGLKPHHYQIPCPFQKDEVEAEDLETFRLTMRITYQAFSETHVRADYDFEIQEEFEHCNCCSHPIISNHYASIATLSIRQGIHTG